MLSRKREIAALLVAATREHDWSVAEPTVVDLAHRLPADLVVAAAAHHRVTGCVAASIRGADVPDRLVESLGVATRRSTGQAMLVAATLRSARAAFGDDLPWLAIKGPILDAALYPRPRLRTYRDLDILVQPGDLQRAVQRLEEAGFQLADRNWLQIRQRMVSQLHLEREGSAPIDLHWTLIFDTARRRAFRLELKDMVARARSVEVAGAQVHTLDAADTLIHLAVHAAIEGADRLVWLKDIDVAARGDLSWDIVVERATAFGVELPVASVLARSHRVLGAPVPAEVLRRLAPRSWRALTSVLDTCFPVAASLGIGSPATLLTRSARDGVGTSLRRAATGFVRRGRTSLAEGRVGRVDRRFDPAAEGSLLYSAGDSADRDEYFSQLARM